MAHLVMHKGETRTLPLEVNLASGDDADLTGAGLTFAAYTMPGEAELISVAATVTDAAAGLAEVVIPDTATEDDDDFSPTQNTTLFYVLRRTVSGNTDIVDAGMLIVRAVA